MNKLLAMSSFIASLMLASPISYADPGQNNGNGRYKRDQNRGYAQAYNNDDENIQELRRQREERGLRRLQQHQWQPGYVMPQHYRGNGYKVDYRKYNLPKPAKNQQWYKINNDYILIDSDSNNIIKIQQL